MAAYAREVIENVRDRADIVDVVSSYVPLKRSGRSFTACCPFHEEKTPSFVVTPERRTFKCFGCGVGGSVFDFVMRQERVEFLEALQLLAERYEIALPEREGRPEDPNRRRDLYSLHQRAADAYLRALAAPEGSDCREYLEGRGLSTTMIRAFSIGYAPGGGRWLADRARRAGVSADVLERSGLAQRSTRGPELRDRFRDRLIFPIRDAQDRVVAFGARTLDGSEPKYLNSPETEIFHKGRILYGLDRLRRHDRSEPILVMEGYTDVIMATQVGVKGAVATLGTSLTPDHARLLARYGERIVLVYDGDRAGLAAAERGAGLLLEAGHLDIQVAVLPEGQDPFDWFRANGPEGAERLLDRTVELVDFLIDRARDRHDLQTDGGRQRATRELLDRARSISDAVARELVVRKIGRVLGIGEVSLSEALVAGRRRVPRARPTTPEGAEVEPEEPTGGRQALRAQQEVLQAVVNQPSLLGTLTQDDLLLFPDPRYRHVIEALVEAAGLAELDPAGMVDLFSDESRRALLVEAMLPPEDSRDLAHQLEAVLNSLRMIRRKEERKPLKEQADKGSLAELQRLYRADKGPAGRMHQGTGSSGAGNLPAAESVREESPEA